MASSLGRAFVLVAPALASLGATLEARAQPAAREVFVPCALRGRAQLPLDTVITDAGGHAIARFGGPELALVVSGFSTAAPARAHIETNTEQSGFRVRGFVNAAKLPVATTEDVPVVAGHVWIGARRSVTVTGATASSIKIEKHLAQPLRQTFAALTPCRTLALGSALAPAWSPAGDARGFVLRGDSVAFYDGPGGAAVATLVRAPAVPGVLFFGEPVASGWVHVTYHGEVVLDGFVPASRVDALPRGETLDQPPSRELARSSARLAVPGAPRVVKAPRDLSLRAAAKDGEPIGVIAAGTETYVIDVVAGWASVVPRALDVMPAQNAQFWVKREELGT
jgi:hypothetical protein